MSLVFYATRTSGTSTNFDQILDFAAIRTDANFGEIERFSAQSRLRAHIVPSPNALLASGLTIGRVNDASLASHYDMVRVIREQLMAWSPSTFVGFKSLNSDEHFLRQCLYQTLHHPYLTNSQGNTRADVAKLIQASLLFAPQALKIPQRDGEYSVDLCTLAVANGLDYDGKCDAIEAVTATIGLARQLNDRAPDLWSTAMRFSKKAAVVDFIENEKVFAYSDFFYGKPHSWLVTLIGANSENGAERYVFNLGVDPDDLVELEEVELSARLAETPKPVRMLRINAAPMLTPESDAPACASGRNLDVAELDRRAETLQSDKELCARLVGAFASTQKQKVRSIHVEEQIYDGFASDSDMLLMERFHAIPWEQRMEIVTRFEDARFKRLGLRLIHSEKPEALDSHARTQHDRAVAIRLLGANGTVPWLTLPAAIEELDALRSGAAAKDVQFLSDLRRHMSSQLAGAQAQLAC